MSKLGDNQREFARMVGLLLTFIYSHPGYAVTFGDAWAKDGHNKGSFHYDRLAIDLNLFKDGIWLKETDDHLMFGEYFESLGGTWGGRFTNIKGGDGNHYSYLELP